ncbi:hypothetical protein PR048_013050 [Dryococelus australis]|uniref:Uncharacterized protein n=1 Tax=Dryococelus australis TaxID=614101 RepID=A0ABQ9HSK3_9NEOP|nr:hypothetical protein PR048_013050 [Dryococelus australis]
MQWLDKNDGMDPTDWGWKLQEGKYLLPMMDKNPVPDELIKLVSCNCSARCNTLQCTCKKNALPCTKGFGICQNGNCDNMDIELVSDGDNY